MTRKDIIKSPYFHLGGIDIVLFQFLDQFKRKFKLSNRQIAKLIGISKSSVNKILEGDSWTLTLEEFYLVCVFLNKIPKIKYLTVTEYLNEDNI